MQTKRECRNNPRLMANLPIRFMLQSMEDRRLHSGFEHSYTWDISLGGVSIITPIIVMNNLHFIEIPIPTICNQIIMRIYIHEKRKPLTALGMAIHRQFISINGHEAYRVGINFLQMSRLDGLELRVFLTSRGRKKGNSLSFGSIHEGNIRL